MRSQRQPQSQGIQILVQPIIGYKDKYLLRGFDEPKIITKQEIQRSLIKLTQEIQIQKRIYDKILQLQAPPRLVPDVRARKQQEEKQSTEEKQEEKQSVKEKQEETADTKPKEKLANKIVKKD